MNIMGLDIGGANTDCCIYEVKNNKVKHLVSKKEYLPMWNSKDKLEDCLKNMKKNYNIDIVIVTTTAELSDGYLSKKEGILDISKKVMNVFVDSTVKFVTFNGLQDYEYVVNNPLSAAAANWVATSHLISKIKEECIFMDMGTTTTDIIPIKNGVEIAKGHSDLERLCSGELVYSGMLRTNLASIVHEVPVNDNIATVSSELFSITADIHRILNNINENEYTCNSPDNKDKSVKSCKRRLTRLICADLDSLADEEIIKIAKYIEKEQINQISKGLLKVKSNTNIQDVIISNYANAKICYEAAKKINMNIISLNDYLQEDIMNISPTVGAIQMYFDTNGDKYKLFR